MATRAWAALLLGHLALVIGVCSKDILLLVAGGYTYLPPALQKSAEQIKATFASAYQNHRQQLDPVLQIATGYQHIAGIETSYCFFAPSVPDSSKLVFEITNDDGQIEYALPGVGNEAAGLRLTGLLYQIGRVQYDPLRELGIKMLAYAIWREHPNARKIRAVFGAVQVPSLAGFRRGEKEVYQFQYAYDFSFGADLTIKR